MVQGNSSMVALTVRELSHKPYGFALEMAAKFMKKALCILCVLCASLGMSICDTSADSKLNMAFINKWTERFKIQEKVMKNVRNFPTKAVQQNHDLLKEREIMWLVIPVSKNNPYLWQLGII